MAPSTSTHALGTRCLELDRAVIVFGDHLVALSRPIEPIHHPYGPAVGLRCTPRTSAIAYPIAARLIDGNPTDSRVAVVVHRHGAAHVVDPERDTELVIDDEFGPVVDVGRRALGLSTPHETTPPVTMLDAIWIDRAVLATLDAGLGTPPRWDQLAALHPLAGSPLAPWMLRDRRLSLPVNWAAFRDRAMGIDTAWPHLAPSLAGWLDDGSFARWILADLPSTRLLLDDLAELLEPHLMADIDEALAGAQMW